ncbi:hypothetical protein BDK51DRAFT_30154 [Blyttiomyces helicus]|uniref:Uncharacterized protein n=1 Tax=Blyttiomyces helicus TaxID=388810 RepID=A0A4P9WLA7_9FUNG|nr:hypothetical protein BDK51DRAFT_30154 [Blyttiomyces helicus]|eukprot:RKO92853.1 hypothetical protein BDK51DRAFT_30154 [Blyttiomyces helicus]
MPDRGQQDPLHHGQARVTSSVIFRHNGNLCVQNVCLKSGGDRRYDQSLVAKKVQHVYEGCVDGGGGHGGRQEAALELSVVGLNHVGFSVVLRVLVLLESLLVLAETFVHHVLGSPRAPGTFASPAGTLAIASRPHMATEAEGRDNAVEVGVLGCNRHAFLEADVGQLSASLGEPDLYLVLNTILEGVPEVEVVSCLEVLGLEGLRDVVAVDDEGIRALFGGDGVIGVCRLNGAFEFVGSGMAMDVGDPSQVVSAIELEL